MDMQGPSLGAGAGLRKLHRGARTHLYKESGNYTGEPAPRSFSLAANRKPWNFYYRFCTSSLYQLQFTNPPPLHSTSVSASSSRREVRHPLYPKACHGAAHQALGALQGPAPAPRRHAFRGAAPASPPAEIQGHGPRLHPARGDEQPRRAGRQRQGTRALLEAHGMARRHQAHHSQRCLRPRALGDVCLHDARFGGPHPCRLPTPP